MTAELADKCASYCTTAAHLHHLYHHHHHYNHHYHQHESSPSSSSSFTCMLMGAVREVKNSSTLPCHTYGYRRPGVSIITFMCLRPADIKNTSHDTWD